MLGRLIAELSTKIILTYAIVLIFIRELIRLQS